MQALDLYLQRQAGQDIRRRIAVAFVATPDGKTIGGYYTLSQYSIDLDELPEQLAHKMPKYAAVPATLIGRLAVSTSFRDQGMGELLLMDALRRCVQSSRLAASMAAVVDAKDEKAARFYKKYGFLELPRIAKRLFLPMTTIEALLR